MQTHGKNLPGLLLPAGYGSSNTYPVIYTADGSAWRKFMALPVILDNLIADRVIEPVMAVMIDSAKDRRSWYFYNPKYLEYLGKVVKYVDKRYSTRADDGRLVSILEGGYNLSGLASAVTAHMDELLKN